MSTLEELKKEVNEVNESLQDSQAECKAVREYMAGLSAHCKAYKQMIDELTQTNLTNRTNLVLTQEYADKLQQQINELLKQNEELKAAKLSVPQSSVKDSKAA